MSPRETVLRVDWPQCRARGLCAELFPEKIRVDEWGYPVVHTSAVDPGPGDVAVPRAGAGVDRANLTRAAY
jgi:hypothetical protein